MLQQCVCRDIEHLGSLESTQEARVARGVTPLSCSPNFPRAQYLDIRTLTHELIVNWFMGFLCFVALPWNIPLHN